MEHDDWGWIRGPDGSLAATARSAGPYDADEHRSNDTDPYQPNAAFIVKCVNAHDALVDALQDCLREHGGFTIKGDCERNARAALALASIKEGV
jgi:hypothetical protein